MWCDPPSISSAAEISQPGQSNGSSSDDGLQPIPSESQEKKQLSFIYQPGIGLYDQKKINLDQDFRLISSTADVDERIQSIDLSPSPSTFNSDVDHRWSCSSTSSSSIESSSPTAKPTNLYKSYLRRQNEQDSLPVRQKLFSNEVILSDKNHQSRSPDGKTPSSIELSETKSLPSNSPSNQENNHKRKCEQDSFSEKKPRRPAEKSQSTPLETKSSTGSLPTTPENSHCERDRLNEELNRQKAKLESIEEQRRSLQPSPPKPRPESRERLPKPAHVPLTKNTSMVKKSSETGKLEISTAGSTVDAVPSQGLLLCPKIEPIKKKKKKKIAPTITANTEVLDVDDSIVDSILFDEMQSVQQQWQQLMMLSMEKELHIQPSEGKKKVKLKKFTRTNEFFLAYESLFDFDGMRHWCPTTRFSREQLMSIASPSTTTVPSNASPAANPLTSLFHSLTKKHSLAPVVQRFVDLCVHNQVKQNDMTPPSSSSSSAHQEHTEKLIRNLIKKLTKMKRQGSIDELERAILHKDSRTKCVTIPRSLDTPVNSSSKSNPVVIYSRLWRWPDLSNQNELKPVDYCPNAFHYGRDDICINPFHYERVPAKYSVYVPHLPPESFRDMPDLRSASMSDILPNQTPENTTYQSTIESQPSPQSYPLSPGSISSQDSLLSPATVSNNDENHHHSHDTAMDLDLPARVSCNDKQLAFQSATQAISPHPSQHSMGNGEQVPFEEPHEWCVISYYEMSTRVSEQFHATQPQVIIDGFTNPSNAERFCLGGLTNVHRTFEIDKARRHIGRGVKLFHIRGNVFAECISDNPVFVQSPITNQRLSWHPATVCKIPPKVRLKIFDSDDFTQILSAAVHEGYEAVYNLMRMCIIRMSFVKGWGVEYRRQAVTCTPCWVEIHLEGPLKWLDTVLSTMRGPTQSITSVS